MSDDEAITELIAELLDEFEKMNVKVFQKFLEAFKKRFDLE